MSYQVKEVFYSLQGEGTNVGRAAVFCRFSGCNLWSGIEDDRQMAFCWLCDTDFAGTDGPNGGVYSSAEGLAAAVARAWTGPRPSHPRPLVVCTGGEPLLQLDEALIEALHDHGFEVAVETNGTVPPPRRLDWICVGPKAKVDLVVRAGHELKLVYPQEGLDPAQLEQLDFHHFFLQPLDGPDLERNTTLAVHYCLEHPRWRLSIQTHKLAGIN